MKPSLEQQIKQLLNNTPIPEHSGHRYDLRATILNAATKSQVQKWHFGFRIIFPSFALAAMLLLAIVFGLPALREELAQRGNDGNANTFLESLAPHELLAESIQKTFGDSDVMRIKIKLLYGTNNQEPTEVNNSVIDVTENAYSIETQFGQTHDIGVEFVRSDPATYSLAHCWGSRNAQLLGHQKQDELICGTSQMPVDDFFQSSAAPLTMELQDPNLNRKHSPNMLSFVTDEPIDISRIGIVQTTFLPSGPERFLSRRNTLTPLYLGLPHTYANKTYKINKPTDGKYLHEFDIETPPGSSIINGSLPLDSQTIFDTYFQIVELSTPTKELTNNSLSPLENITTLVTRQSPVFQLTLDQNTDSIVLSKTITTAADINQLNHERIEKRKQQFIEQTSGQGLFDYFVLQSPALESIQNDPTAVRVEKKTANETVLLFTKQLGVGDAVETVEVHIDVNTGYITSIDQKFDGNAEFGSFEYKTILEVESLDVDPTVYFTETAVKQRFQALF